MISVLLCFEAQKTGTLNWIFSLLPGNWLNGDGPIR